MKSFLINLFGFVSFSAVIYLLLLLVWGSIAPSFINSNLKYRIGSSGHMFTRFKEVKEVKNIDVLFLGSSHTYRGFDTRIFAQFGYSSFNLGSSSQTPKQTNVLLKRYLKDLNPKFIIYEVYPVTFTLDGIESSLDIISNDENDIFSYRMALELNHIKTYNTLIYGCFRDIFNLNKSFLEPKSKNNDTYVSGGYVENKTFNDDKEVYLEKILNFNEEQLKDFSDIISFLTHYNIPVILVYAPIPPSNYNSYLNNEYFDSIMNSYSDYYNFNELLYLNDSLHFYDSHHLNQNGVEVFNRELIRILESKNTS